MWTSETKLTLVANNDEYMRHSKGKESNSYYIAGVCSVISKRRMCARARNETFLWFRTQISLICKQSAVHIALLRQYLIDGYVRLAIIPVAATDGIKKVVKQTLADYFGGKFKRSLDWNKAISKLTNKRA